MTNALTYRASACTQDKASEDRIGDFVMEGFIPLGPTSTQQVTIKGGEAVWGTRDTFRELAWVRDAHQYGIRCYALEIADEVIYQVANSFQ